MSTPKRRKKNIFEWRNEFLRTDPCLLYEIETTLILVRNPTELFYIATYTIKGSNNLRTCMFVIIVLKLRHSVPCKNKADASIYAVFFTKTTNFQMGQLFSEILIIFQIHIYYMSTKGTRYPWLP